MIEVLYSARGATYKWLPSGLRANPVPFTAGLVEMMALVSALITTSPSVHVAYTLLPSGLTVMPNGCEPTGIVAVTVLLAVLITATFSDPRFPTKARPPTGLTATQYGKLIPAEIVAITLFVIALITETVLSL